ncbi:hypothetical protein [Streptomyces sp. AC550_RSS872]|uniref:hypothetical protein n=1 Tax=Streptomyces sp. AC550_RSS872 TaxID=2823689 RepID=UPI001C26EF69|nr:hypothetical protein [Streptomyces sp. AC550_RSS872]
MSDACASLADSVRADVAGSFDLSSVSLDDSFVGPHVNPITVPRPTAAPGERFYISPELVDLFRAESVAGLVELVDASVNRRKGK